MSRTIRYWKALGGREPAEALNVTERGLLMRVLHGQGWTDVHIAEHTQWSTYTVARIRDRLGLVANRESGVA